MDLNDAVASLPPRELGNHLGGIGPPVALHDKGSGMIPEVLMDLDVCGGGL
jgi:hypothetical protein